MVPVARFAIRRSPANRDRDTLTAIAVLLECGAGATNTAIFKGTASRRFRKDYWAIRLDGRRSPLPRSGFVQYNPVGYILSAIKDAEDIKLKARKQMTEERAQRTLQEAKARF
jgi:hypothetical protein